MAMCQDFDHPPKEKRFKTRKFFERVKVFTQHRSVVLELLWASREESEKWLIPIFGINKDGEQGCM